MIKASFTIFDTLHKRELHSFIKCDKDPRKAVKNEISSHKEEIRNFCKTRECFFALRDEENEKILDNGCIVFDRHSGLLNVKPKISS